MIAWLEGVLREKAPTRAVLEVRGVGYELQISLTTFGRLPDTGKTLALHVHTHVREDALQLFGFATERERTAFEMLLKAGRVGPRLALNILSGIEPPALFEALRSGDLGVLRRVPGVGPKLAERIAVELRDRAAELALEDAEAGTGAPVGGARAVTAEVVSVLTNLGYPRARAERVAEQGAQEAGDEASLEWRIRDALRRLSR